MKLDQNDFLLIELVDESIIAIKKINPQLSKSEVNKITSQKNDTVVKEKQVIVEDKSPELEEEFDNPLQNLKL